MFSKVFLVMTVYNREAYLPMALDSIIGQTYPHWQLTIWDDGSGDASPDIARKYTQLAACRSETPEALSSKQLPCEALIAVIQ